MKDEKIQQKIAQNIKKFDLCALLKLLRTLGYQRANVIFEGNTNQASYNSLCHAIYFDEDPRRARIVVNIGLLGPLSPLPSFFQNLVDREDVDSTRFISYLNFFNHRLIDNFIRMTLPETHENLFSSWKQTQLNYLSLLGFESVSTLWFLMKICFPDLVVEVKKNPQIIKLQTSSLVLGRDVIGYNSYLGNRFKQTLSSYKITFSTEDELSDVGTPWPIEINRRLVELIYPILKKTDLHFSIVLKIKNKFNYLTLGSKTYLGFDRVGKSSHPFQLLLYYGLIKDLKRNKYFS